VTMLFSFAQLQKYCKYSKLYRKEHPLLPTNSIHHAVALETFKQAATSLTYSFIGGVDVSKVKDGNLLACLYNYFVWVYLKGIYDREEWKPGAQHDKLHGGQM
jgi:hypothetical protein